MIAPMDHDSLATERAQLVRFCARYTGNPDVAEDLAQQTLLDAWRHEHRLRDPQARRGWLFSIARNTCIAWSRRHGGEHAHRLDSPDGAGLDDVLADGFDLELDLERSELAELLDRALALLPPETRDVLVRRYVDDLPQAEVATLLGLTEGAVEARVHRGKLALRRLLATHLRDEAVSHGLIRPNQSGWQETRLWCPGCGRRRLRGWLAPDAGRLDLHCPDCTPLSPENYIHAHMGDGLRDVRMFKPAVSRVLAGIHDMFRIRLAQGGIACPSCGTWLPLRQSPGGGIVLACDRCDWVDQETWHSLTWSLPAARRFWREHPRMRFMPPREIEIDGVPAILTGFESVTDRARLEVVALRDSLRVVSIEGTAHAAADHHAAG